MSEVAIKEVAIRREMILWACGGLTGACFACALCAINSKMQGLAAITSIRLTALMIPTMVFNLIVHKEPNPSRYRFGPLAWMIPFAGVIAGVGAIGAFLWSYDPFSGIAFVFAVGLVVALLVTADLTQTGQHKRLPTTSVGSSVLGADSPTVP
jgi:peptidoglycan/LPS O-acetylase OafA/YrhL